MIGDIFGWRGVFFFTGAIDLVALAVAIPRISSMAKNPDASTCRHWFRTIVQSSAIRWPSIVSARFLLKLCFIRCVSLHGGLLRRWLERASIAGVVIAGFGIGGVIYTFMVAWLLANIGERRLMAAGGMTMGFAC